jgi:DNA primase
MKNKTFSNDFIANSKHDCKHNSNYNMISEKTIESCKNISIVTIAERIGLKLKKIGSQFVTSCPFHKEKTPSCYLTDGKGFKCFGCNESGGSIKFYQKLCGIDKFKDVILAMASEFSINVEYENDSQSQSQNDVPKKIITQENKTVKNNAKKVVAMNIDFVELAKTINPNLGVLKTRQVGGCTEVRVTYNYSDSQSVERIERFDSSNIRIEFQIGSRPKSLKHIIPHHIDDSGETQNNKGDLPWGFYGQSDAVTHGKGKFVLMVEGEKCADVIRQIGLVAVSRMGADKKPEAIKRNFQALSDAGVEGVIFISDNDEPGEKECETFSELATDTGLKTLTLKTLDLYPEAQKGDDVVDWVIADHELSHTDFIKNIELAIDKKINFANKTESEPIEKAIDLVKKVMLSEIFSDIQKAVKIDKIKEEFKIKTSLWEEIMKTTRYQVEKIRLNLELKALLQSDDKLEQLFQMTAIAQRYRVSMTTLKEAVKLMKQRTLTPEFEIDSLDDLFNAGSQAIDYLVPGLLPKGESALLVAMPKVGKSLLGIDLAFAVATGEDNFLGETCKQGKVLLVSVDESKQSTGRKLSKRGFRVSDKDNIRIVTKFNVEQLGKLEAEIEDFRPALVIIDSLKRITSGSEISENSAEFADSVYEISELCNRYGSSCLLIHHSKKNNESTGVENARGSTAITGALGNVWVLDRIGKEDPNNKKKVVYDPRDGKRKLYCYSRDSEGKAFDIEFNPENNSWTLLGEMGMSDEEQKEQKTAKNRILALMQLNQKQHPSGVSGAFLHECLELQSPGSVTKAYMYVVLNRLTDDKIITSKPAPGDKRYTLYSLLGQSVNDNDKEDIIVKNVVPPSPPLEYVSNDMQYSKTHTEHDVKDTYHTHINPISSNQQNNPILDDDIYSNPYSEGDTEYISSQSDIEGEGGRVLDDDIDLNDNDYECLQLMNRVVDSLIDNDQPFPDDYKPTPQVLVNAKSLPPLTGLAVDSYKPTEDNLNLMDGVYKSLDVGDMLIDNQGSKFYIIGKGDGYFETNKGNRVTQADIRNRVYKLIFD